MSGEVMNSVIIKAMNRYHKCARGITTLEYLAGAAMVLGLVWGAMTVLGGDMAGMIGAISTWVRGRTGEIGG